MTDKLGFKYFDVKIDPSKVEDEIVDILVELRPQWSKEDLRTQVYTDGFVNSMTCFFQAADTAKRDALVVRVYGLERENLPLEREKEFLTLQVAHAAGCFPAIVASFRNGLIYNHEPGRVVNFHDLTNPDNIKTLTRLLYRFQHIDVDNLELFNRKGEPETYDKTVKGFEMSEMYIKQIPDGPKDKTKEALFQELRRDLTDEYLMAEFEFLKDLIKELKLPIALGHSDFHPRNIIINEETGNITFIDYEVSTFTVECTDLGRLFVAFCDPGEPDITEEIQKMYCREYLNARNSAQGRQDITVGDEEIELLLTQIRINSIAGLFSFFIFGLAFMDLQLKDLTFLEVIPDNIRKYKEGRVELPMLQDRCIELQKQIDTK